MDLEDLKDDMLALRAELKPLLELVQHGLARVAELLKAAEKSAQDMAEAGSHAREELHHVEATVGAWKQEAVAGNEMLTREMQALEDELEAHLPLLQTAREGLAEAQKETSAAAGTMQKDLADGGHQVETADHEAAAALEALGHEAQEGETLLKQSVEGAQTEAHSLEADTVLKETNELKTELETLDHDLALYATNVVQKVSDVDRALGTKVDELTTAVGEAIQTMDAGHQAFLQALAAGVQAQLDEWRQKTQDAVDATDELVHDVDQATQKVEKSVEGVESFLKTLEDLPSTIDGIVGAVKTVADTVGVLWGL
jgi:hypothetical protein